MRKPRVIAIPLIERLSTRVARVFPSAPSIRYPEVVCQGLACPYGKRSDLCATLSSTTSARPVSLSHGFLAPSTSVTEATVVAGVIDLPAPHDMQCVWLQLGRQLAGNLPENSHHTPRGRVYEVV